MEEAKKELMKAIGCLYLEIPGSIVNDIKAKAKAYIEAAEKTINESKK